MTTRGSTDRSTLTQEFPSNSLLHLPDANVPERSWQVALEALKIRSSCVGTVEQPPARLIQRYQQTDALIQEHELAVRFFGYAPLFNGPLIYEAQNCDWAIMNLAEDPFYTEHNKKLVVPRAVRQEINNLHAAGLSFDTICIAHEIPKGTVTPGDDVPYDLIAPPPAREALERLPKTSLWHSIAVRLGAVATHVSTGMATIAARDPVLFGVQFDETWQVGGRPIGVWYYLTHWFWDEGDTKP